jgi:hypothetical protein
LSYALLLTGAIAVGVAIYITRLPAPQPREMPQPASVPAPASATAPTPGAAAPPQVPAPPPAAAPNVPNRAPSSGKLGIDHANCPGFAEIAGQFWVLKQQGRNLEFVFAAIEQSSQGDARKINTLKALAQVVYANPTPTRDLAYSSALGACLKQ